MEHMHSRGTSYVRRLFDMRWMPAKQYFMGSLISCSRTFKDSSSSRLSSDDGKRGYKSLPSYNIFHRTGTCPLIEVESIRFSAAAHKNTTSIPRKLGRKEVAAQTLMTYQPEEIDPVRVSQVFEKRAGKLAQPSVRKPRSCLGQNAWVQ